MMNIYILADHNSTGGYSPTELNESLDALIDNLEYQDVKDGTYQIWEYPSGRIYDLSTDRDLGQDENQYATPFGSKGVVWLPKLVEVGTDVEKAREAYSILK